MKLINSIYQRFTFFSKYKNPEDIFSATVIQGFIVVLFFTYLVSLFFVPGDFTRLGIIIAPTLILSPVLFFLLRKGFLEFATFGIFLTQFFSLFYGGYTGGGIEAPIVVASVALGVWPLFLNKLILRIILYVILFISVIGLYVLTVNNFLPAFASGPKPIQHLFALIITLLLVLVFVSTYINQFRSVIKEMNRSAQEALASQKALVKQQDWIRTLFPG
jgi:hypothetical protein